LYQNNEVQIAVSRSSG